MRRSLKLCTVGVTAGVFLLSGCASRKGGADLEQPPYGISAAEAEGLTPEEYAGSLGSARMEKFVAMYRLLGQSEARVHELEVQLGIAEPDSLAVSVAEPGPAGELGAAPGMVGEPGLDTLGMAPEPVAGGMTTVVLPDDQELVLTALRDELLAERARRDELELELERLRTESSAGPFERGQDVALEKAEDEIAALKTALRQEGRARDELQRRYDILRRQLDTKGSEAVAIAENVALREKITELKLEQQSEIDRLKRELAKSKAREEELLGELDAARAAGPATGVSLAGYEKLEGENETLRAELEEERQRSKALEARLQVAMRVSDLLFRMDAQGR